MRLLILQDEDMEQAVHVLEGLTAPAQDREILAILTRAKAAGAVVKVALVADVVSQLSLSFFGFKP